MERALDLARLAEALGIQSPLPEPEELQRLLADAEIALFSQQPHVSEELLTTGWYLHGVAASDPRYEVYSANRQRRAFQVSAHIFDLALAGSARSRPDQLRLAFAAQIGYRRGELDPNATAIYTAVRSLLETGTPLLKHVETVAVEAGVALLGFQSRDLFPILRRWREGFAALRERLDLDSLASTIFGPAASVVDAAWHLLRFLVFGNEPALTAGRNLLDAALAPRQGLDAEDTMSMTLDDLDARWVAAHLRQVADDVDEGSVWRVLPPDVPSAARQALTLSSPPVLTLWRPQRDLLLQDTEHSPLAEETRRLVMSVPTSAGKTLMAQLFVLTHLATSFGSVCYVTPMRSLARELRRAMSGRLRILEKELGRDYPDWYLAALSPEDISELEPDLDIMTPERLLHLLRHDPESVLDKYSLFVFDEAQMLGERGRGLVLEQVLSFIHWRTRDQSHRILLLSAALGNRGQIAQWLRTSDGPARLFESEWRGARRLHALFSTGIDWDTERREAVRSSGRPWRVYHPLIGLIRLRPAESGQPARLQLAGEVGEIAFRESGLGQRVGGREGSASTPFYRTVAQLIRVVGDAGPVLTVTSTRADSTRMARAIADELPRDRGTALLADFVERRLGAEHPLTAVVPRGVAFHHAALPTDVLEAIEDAFRGGVIRHVACTSTLTEGVNLPARTVVLAETRYPGQPQEALLSGGRLVNAIGRAGRAGKETEGWVILALQAQESLADFDLLRPTDEELQVDSTLVTSDALGALAEYEERVARGEDAVFSDAAREIDGFISFVWFLLAAEERRDRPPEDAQLQQALGSTFAFTQLSDSARGRWGGVAEAVRASYTATPAERRRRWAESGTSINSARKVEDIARDLAVAAADREDRDQLDRALELVTEVNVLERLLALSEAPARWRFKRSRGGPIVEIPVSPEALLRAWIEGRTPTEMANDYLAAVPARDFAVEQVVDATAQHFEHYLSWTLGAVFDQANRLLEEPELCRSVPLYVRYGVGSTLAVDLLTRGVRSRPLVVAVAHGGAAADLGTGQVVAWLGQMSITDWRELFDASPGDVLDLLDVIRSGKAGAVRELLEEGTTSLSEPTCAEEAEVSVKPVSAADGQGPLGVFRVDSGDRVATVPSPLHADVQALLDTGMVSRVLAGPDGLRFVADLAE